MLNYPDFVVFDLDPYLYSGKEETGAEPELNRDGFAADLRGRVLAQGAARRRWRSSSFVKTTGKTGLHIYVPIAAHTSTTTRVRAVSETLAKFLVQQHPKRRHDRVDA